jgi:hypothetical protein
MLDMYPPTEMPRDIGAYLRDMTPLPRITPRLERPRDVEAPKAVEVTAESEAQPDSAAAVENAAQTAEESSVVQPTPGVAGSNAVENGIRDWVEKAMKRESMERKGMDTLNSMEENGESPMDVARKFWADTYFKLPGDVQQKFKAMLKNNQGMTPEEVESIGFDLPTNVRHLEGTERGFVALMRDANAKFEQPIPEASPAAQLGGITPNVSFRVGDSVRVKNSPRIETIESIGDDGWVYTSEGAAGPANQFTPATPASEAPFAGTFAGYVSDNPSPSFAENVARWKAKLSTKETNATPSPQPPMRQSPGEASPAVDVPGKDAAPDQQPAVSDGAGAVGKESPETLPSDVAKEREAVAKPPHEMSPREYGTENQQNRLMSMQKDIQRAKQGAITPAEYGQKSKKKLIEYLENALLRETLKSPDHYTAGHSGIVNDALLRGEVIPQGNREIYGITDRTVEALNDPFARFVGKNLHNNVETLRTDQGPSGEPSHLEMVLTNRSPAQLAGISDYIKRYRPELSDSVDEIVQRLGAKPEPSAERAPPATHTEDGTTEPATPEVVAESITKSAANTDMNMKQAREWLIQQIDDSIAAAPSVPNNKGHDLEKEYGYTTFDVPGDGKFKILNTKETLERFKKQVTPASGFRDEGRSPMSLGTSASKTTPREMLDDGDLLMAADYAKLIKKPLMFGVPNKNMELPVYTDAEDAKIPGFDTMVGRNLDKGTRSSPWHVIELTSGLSFSSGKTKEEAIRNAKEAVAAEGKNKLLAKLVSELDKNPQESLEANWREWATAQEEEAQAARDAKAKRQKQIDESLAKMRERSSALNAFNVGQTVKFKKNTPDGLIKNIAGRIVAINPDGTVEVKTQNDGYQQVRWGLLTPVEEKKPPVNDVQEEFKRGKAASFKNLDTINAVTNPLSQGDRVRLADGSEWELRAYSGHGLSLMNGKTEHPTVRNIRGQNELIQAILAADRDSVQEFAQGGAVSNPTEELLNWLKQYEN